MIPLFRISSSRQVRQKTAILLSLAAVCLMALPAGAAYIQTNLVSDIPGLAANTDPNLKNPWGLAYPPTGPFWSSDNRAGVATLYNADGQRFPVGSPLVVTIPVPAGSAGPTGPTGVVFNGGSDFAITGGPARFIFSTLNGTIAAWNAGTQAIQQVAVPGAVFTGLTLANNGTGNFLYAANAAGGINVFNSSFQPVTLAGNFSDPTIPAGFTPYNIQELNGRLYVTYSQRTVPGGFVDVFDTNGNFIRRVASNGPLDEPWGLVLAPATFGQFANDLLVGNFLNGRISAFDPLTDAFLGQLTDALGNPLANPGLWALKFGNGGTAGSPNDLFFTAGINNEADGLFGRIRVAAVPEPGVLVLLASGMALLMLGMRRG